MHIYIYSREGIGIYISIPVTKPGCCCHTRVYIQVAAEYIACSTPRLKLHPRFGLKLLGTTVEVGPFPRHIALDKTRPLGRVYHATLKDKITRQRKWRLRLEYLVESCPQRRRSASFCALRISRENRLEHNTPSVGVGCAILRVVRYTLGHPGTNPGCCGNARVCTRVAAEYVYSLLNRTL